MNPVSLVIGGGVAGMTSAKNLAEQGYEVHLVERSRELGGTGLTSFTRRGEAKISRVMSSGLLKALRTTPLFMCIVLQS